MMRKENIDFLELHREVIDEINNAETATKASKISGELHRIIKQEFLPGYAFTNDCGSCLFDMTRLVYRRFDEWKQEDKPIGEMIVAANFPSHKPEEYLAAIKDLPIFHFYHIYADGQWQEPVSEHIKALKEYGLYDALKTFRIGIVGKFSNRHFVRKYLDEQGLKYEVAGEEIEGWEQVTQTPMHQFTKENDGLMLYAHSKGASNPSEVNVRWRRSMIWHNVCQWKFAVEKLQEHKSYGCHWIQPLITGMPEHRQGNFMNAGTFFWAHCNLMRTWMKPPLNHRYEAEGWIGYKYSEEPWPVWDCTPYFPNTDSFMDGWMGNHDYKPEQRGKSIPPQQTINVLPQ